MRDTTSASRLVAAALTLVLAACAGSPDFRMVAETIAVEGATSELPASWEAGVIRVDAAIGNGEPVTLLLDTGASAFVLSPEAVERARLRVRDPGSGSGGVPISDAHGSRVIADRIARIDRLRCGPLEVRNVDALVRDLADFERVAGVRIDGILPATAFLGQWLMIDGPQRLVSVERAAGPTLSGPDTLELEDAGVPLARIAVAGRQVPLLLDTGSQERLALPVALEDELDLVAPPVETGRALGLSGAVPRRHARLAVDLALAGHTLRSPIVVLTSAQRASAGMQLLREFRMTLDLEGRRVRLARDSDTALESAPLRGIGIGFLRGTTTWEVAYVTTGGGGDRAGVRAGDVVSRIADTPVAGLRAQRLDALLAGRPSVTLRLDGPPAPRDVFVQIDALVD